MGRSYRGNRPSEADGYVRRISTDSDGIRWEVWTAPQRRNPDWTNIKVVAITPVKGRANYWFAIEPSTGKRAFMRDLMELLEKHPTIGQMSDDLLKELDMSDIF
jgi:hypothetical protein